MSRYIGKNADPILEAAAVWRDRCLVREKSVFTDHELWTMEHIVELEKNFVDKPDLSSDSFIEKLKNQLAPTKDATKRLTAEMMWLLLLFVSNTGPDKKREIIGDIWGWAGPEPDIKGNTLLVDDVLSGIGSGGTSFNTGRWRELGYFIALIKDFKSKSPERQKRLLSDPWDWGEWLESLSGSDRRQFRHMLSYLLFPDDYERICSRNDKRTLIQVFTGKTKKDTNQMSLLAIDQALRDCRTDLEQKHSRTDLDFYKPPLRSAWKADENDDDSGDLDEEISYWLVGGYWEGDDMTPTFVEEGRWENGYTDKYIEEVNGVKPGDRIAIKSTYTRKNDLPFDNKGERVSCMMIKAVGTVRENPKDGKNLKVDWKSDHKEFEVYNYTYRTTITRIDSSKWPMLIDWVFNDVKQPLEEAEAHPEPVELSQEVDEAPFVQSEARNVIFYGPPGTGKTYRVRKKMVSKYTEKPVGGADTQKLKVDLIDDLSWWEVILAALIEMGGKGKVPAIAQHPFFRRKAEIQGRESTLNNQIWTSLQSHTPLESKTVGYAQRLRRAPYVFDKEDDGTWKLFGNWREECTEIVESVEQSRGQMPKTGDTIQRYVFVTFHQSYSYEEFVEGIRPVLDDSGDQPTYEVRKGAFRRICDHAKADPENRYAIVIDEINRGNISKIFGELITLIEPDKRAVYGRSGNLVDGMEVVLPYSGKPFGVPKNLDVYGTMNTADRSIALLDTALRRRFDFEELTPDVTVIKGEGGDGYIPDGEGGLINLRELLQAMNSRIRFLLNRDQMIGHSYFCRVTTFSTLKRIMLSKIVPLLQEYFYEDWHRIQLVLRDVGPEGKPITPQIVRHTKAMAASVLGVDSDEYEEVVEYSVARPEDIGPEAFRKICEV